MDTIQFEGVKVAIKQDKTGYVLTLCIHPDEIPEHLLRDFVGARYQVVMVRIDDTEKPYKRREPTTSNRAAILCKDPLFQKFLVESGLAWDASERSAEAFLKETCTITSRAELDSNVEAADTFKQIVGEYEEWKSTSV
ncbi:MAG: hypothetical protein EBR82_49950 [Caulobacteraceae bacterium]|nr:hypothetical protein [Caulobacteraceae bacterium]